MGYLQVRYVYRSAATGTPQDHAQVYVYPADAPLLVQEDDASWSVHSASGEAFPTDSTGTVSFKLPWAATSRPTTARFVIAHQDGNAYIGVVPPLTGPIDLEILLDTYGWVPLPKNTVPIQTSQGMPGLVWQPGGWSSILTYVPTQAVQYAGSAYIALKPNTNVVPGTDPATWDLIAGIAGAAINGDLTGTLPNPTVTNLSHVTNGSLATAGLANLAVTDAKIAGMAASKLSGMVPLGNLSGITDAQIAAANKDGTAGTASLRTLGTGAQQAAAGNDARLSNARTPTLHASTHGFGGSDAVSLDASQIGSGALGKTRLPGSTVYTDQANAFATMPTGPTPGVTDASTTLANTAAIWAALPDFDVHHYGAKGDAVVLADVAMTSGSAVLTSASASFTAQDVGKPITVLGAGAAWTIPAWTVSGAAGKTVPNMLQAMPLYTTILSRQSATQVTLAVSASKTVSAAQCIYGADDTAAIQAASDAAKANNGGNIKLRPGHRYIIAFGGQLAALGAIITSDYGVRFIGNNIHLDGHGASIYVIGRPPPSTNNRNGLGQPPPYCALVFGTGGNDPTTNAWAGPYFNTGGYWVENVKVEHLTIDGSFLALTDMDSMSLASASGPIIFARCRDYTLNEVRVIAAWGADAAIHNSNGCIRGEITRCRVIGSWARPLVPSYTVQGLPRINGTLTLSASGTAGTISAVSVNGTSYFTGGVDTAGIIAVGTQIYISDGGNSETVTVTAVTGGQFNATGFTAAFAHAHTNATAYTLNPTYPGLFHTNGTVTLTGPITGSTTAQSVAVSSVTVNGVTYSGVDAVGLLDVGCTMQLDFGLSTIETVTITAVDRTKYAVSNVTAVFQNNHLAGATASTKWEDTAPGLGSYAYGIDNDGGQRSIMLGNYIENCGQGGYNWPANLDNQVPNHNNRLVGNQAFNVGVDYVGNPNVIVGTGQAGINVAGNRDTLISGNDVVMICPGVGLNISASVYTTTGYASADRINVIGNRFRRVYPLAAQAGPAILISGADWDIWDGNVATSYNDTIHANRIEGPWGTGISLNSQVQKCSIAGNYLEQNTQIVEASLLGGPSGSGALVSTPTSFGGGIDLGAHEYYFSHIYGGWLASAPATGQAVATLSNPVTASMFTAGQSVTLVGGGLETLTIKSVVGTTVTFTTNIATANHTAITVGESGLSAALPINATFGGGSQCSVTMTWGSQWVVGLKLYRTAAGITGKTNARALPFLANTNYTQANTLLMVPPKTTASVSYLDQSPDSALGTTWVSPANVSSHSASGNFLGVNNYGGTGTVRMLDSNPIVQTQAPLAIGSNPLYFDPTQPNGIFPGVGVPNGVVTARQGSLYADLTQANFRPPFWSKTQGTDNNGWIPQGIVSVGDSTLTNSVGLGLAAPQRAFVTDRHADFVYNDNVITVTSVGTSPPAAGSTTLPFTALNGGASTAATAVMAGNQFTVTTAGVVYKYTVGSVNYSTKVVTLAAGQTLAVNHSNLDVITVYQGWAPVALAASIFASNGGSITLQTPTVLLLPPGITTYNSATPITAGTRYAQPLRMRNISTFNCTIPTGGNVNVSANLVIKPNQEAQFWWDGSSWQPQLLPDGLLSSNVALLNTAQSWTAAQTLQRVILNGTGTTQPLAISPNSNTPHMSLTPGPSNGAPSSGTWLKGDTYVDASASMWMCTVAGTPGTWTQVGGSVTTDYNAEIPQKYGYDAWSFSMLLPSASFNSVSGTMYLSKIFVPSTTTFNTFYFALASVSSTVFTANQNFCAIYASSGGAALWSSTAGAIDASLALGRVAATISGGVSVTGGAGVWVWAAVLLNWTGTAPKFSSLPSTQPGALLEAGTTNATSVTATYGTLQTSVPSVTPSSASGTTTWPWMALKQ